MSRSKLKHETRGIETGDAFVISSKMLEEPASDVVRFSDIDPLLGGVETVDTRAGRRVRGDGVSCEAVRVWAIPGHPLPSLERLF
jgi:hypothetical protein